MDGSLSYDELQSLFVRIRPELVRQIRRRVRCYDTAEDLAQDVFLKLDRITHRLPTESEARRYLLRMAANIALDYHRVRANRERLHEHMAPLTDCSAADGRSIIELRRMLDRTQAAMAALSARQRTVLLKSRIEGMTYAEIASELGVSISLVEKEVANALRTLVCALNSEDSAGSLQRDAVKTRRTAAPASGDRPRIRPPLN